MRAIDLPDLARGARVELLVEAIESGDRARALGRWAEMPADERAEFGPLIWTLLPANGGASR